MISSQNPGAVAIFAYRIEALAGREVLLGDRAHFGDRRVERYHVRLAVKHGARGPRTFVVAAPFNNMKGFLGEMMRAGDMIPMNTTMHGTASFNKEVEHILTKKKDFLLIYPEASMWWRYKKVRPYKDGGFYIAEKYGVPVVPQFITYRASGKKDTEGIDIPYFTLHIAEPIYPKKELSKQENIEYLRQSAFEACKKIYEETYGEKLAYEKE